MKSYLVSLLRINSIKYFWGLIAPIIVKIMGIRLSAALTALGIDWGNVKTNGPTVLCISRFYFEKDIRELRNRTEMNFVQILGGFTRFQELWIPEGMRAQTFYQFYNGPDKEVAIEKSTKYAEWIIKTASRKRRIDAVLSANFDYWQDIGFKETCKEIGIPFLVLSREHPITRHAIEMCVRHYTEKGSFAFEGTAIAVAGWKTHEMIKQSSGVMKNMDDVWITGLPRLDIWRDVDTRIGMKDRDCITLITYTIGYSADNDYSEVVRAFAELGSIHAGMRFVVKCKDYDDYMENKRLIGSEYSRNVFLDYTTPLYEVLPRSRVVLGYNSLALIEAALSRSAIVIPNWGEHSMNEDGMLFKKNECRLSGCLRYPTSIEEMKDCIVDAVNGNVNLIEREDALMMAKDYFHIENEKSASRNVEEFIQYYISRAHGARKDASKAPPQ